MSMESRISSWLRCYRCWSRNLEVQVHYDAIRPIDPETGIPTEGDDEIQESVVQCLTRCMTSRTPDLRAGPGGTDRGSLGTHGGRDALGRPHARSRSRPIRSRPAGPEAVESLTFGAFGDAGTREFFHPRPLPQAPRGPDRRTPAGRAVRPQPGGGERRADRRRLGTIEITSLAEESRLLPTPRATPVGVGRGPPGPSSQTRPSHSKLIVVGGAPSGVPIGLIEPTGLSPCLHDFFPG